MTKRSKTPQDVYNLIQIEGKARAMCRLAGFNPSDIVNASLWSTMTAAERHGMELDPRRARKRRVEQWQQWRARAVEALAALGVEPQPQKTLATATDIRCDKCGSTNDACWWDQNLEAPCGAIPGSVG